MDALKTPHPHQHRPPHGRRRLALILTTVGVTMCASLVLAEVGLRAWLTFTFRHSIENLPRGVSHPAGTPIEFRQMFYRDEDPKLIVRMKPHLKGFFLGHELSLNAHGFRDMEHDSVKTSDTLRIAVLGDSTIFGWGVNSNERFPDLLRDRLAHAFRGRNRIEIV